MPTIVAILFTYSWGGYTVRYRDGTTESLSPKQLLARVGEAEYYRLAVIAHRLPGHWQPAVGGGS
jgi:hypothetical protein